MAVGQVFKFVFKIGKDFVGTNSKSIADNYVKQGLKKVPKNKIPKDANIKKAPSVPNPRSGGKFTKPQPVGKPKTTRVAPKKPSATGSSVTSGSKPSNLPSAPKKPSVPATSSPKQPRTSSTTKKKKPPMMPKSMVKERPNLPPKPLTNRPGLLRDSARPEAPEIDKDSIRDTTKRGPSTRTSPKAPKKQEGPSKRGKPTKTKKMSPGSSPRPKLRPEKKTTTRTQPKRATSPKPKNDPLKNWSEPRRKALKSNKIGQDAGDGMVWVVGKNSNALVRVRPNDPRVAEQKRLKKSL